MGRTTTPQLILEQTLVDYLQQHELMQRAFVVSYSGGLDSHVLLDVLVQLRTRLPQLKLTAIHVDHGLQACSNDFATHCQQICDYYHVPLIIKQLGLRIAQGESVEAVARFARYTAIKESLTENDCLLTAQHQDDEGETLLLQLFRGAGVKGLRTMAAAVEHGIHRPFLTIPRSTLVAYAKERSLNYIDDPTNEDERFDRNFMRKQIIPHLKQRFPGVVVGIARAARLQAQTQELLEEVAQQDLQQLIDNHFIRTQIPMLLPPALTNLASTSAAVEVNRFGYYWLPIVELSALSLGKQNNLIRYWLAAIGVALPSEVKLAELHRTVIFAKPDQQPHLVWGQVEARRYHDRLYVGTKLLSHDTTQTINWNVCDRLMLASSYLELDPKHLPHRVDLTQGPLSIRFRQGGERFKWPAAQHHTCLKQYFQAQSVLPWLRDRVPLLYQAEKLLFPLAIKLYSSCT